jgi:hypothetical protein
MTNRRQVVKDPILDRPGRKKHELIFHGWTSDKSYCDFANWWDCSFWCGNNKLFGKKLPPSRFCPMTIPNHENCPIIKAKNNIHIWEIKHDTKLSEFHKLFYQVTGLEPSYKINEGIEEILREVKHEK